MLGKLFKAKSSTLIGIDIGSHAIKAVVLKHSGNSTATLDTSPANYQLANLTTISTPKGLIVDREITDIEGIAKVISLLRQRIPKAVSHAAVAVSGASVITKIIYMDAAFSEEELESQILIEADSLIPYPSHEISLDFESLGPNPTDASKANILVSAARTESIETRVSALEQGGFKAKVVDVESFALARAATLCLSQFSKEALSQPVAIIDIGATMMITTVIENGETIYTRDQALGGEQLTQSLSESYQLELEDAEMAKRQNTIPNDDMFGIVENYRQAVTQQIRRALQLFSSSTGRDPIQFLLVSGGSVHLKGLLPQISQELGIDVQLANPFHAMESTHSTQQVPSEYMIALGLALRSFSTCHI